MNYKVLEKIKVFSLCEVFAENEDVYDILSDYSVPDSYIEYRVNADSRDLQEKEISNLLIKEGADDKELVFIHIDY